MSDEVAYSKVTIMVESEGVVQSLIVPVAVDVKLRDERPWLGIFDPTFLSVTFVNEIDFTLSFKGLYDHGCGYIYKQSKVYPPVKKDAETKQEMALRRLAEITKGIDKDDCELEDGWWETEVGANYGKQKLSELQALIKELTE